MKTMSRCLLGTLLALSSTMTFAGQEGHGGGVHYCPGKNVEVEFYDLYEAREVWDKIIPSYEGKSVDEILDVALEKIGTRNPLLSQYIGHQIKKVNSMIRLKPNQQLTRI